MMLKPWQWRIRLFQQVCPLPTHTHRPHPTPVNSSTHPTTKQQPTHLESVILFPLHDVEQEGSDDVEALAVPDPFVPASVGQQHTLQDGSVLLVVLAAEAAAPCAVEILHRGRPCHHAEVSVFRHAARLDLQFPGSGKVNLMLMLC